LFNSLVGKDFSSYCFCLINIKTELFVAVGALGRRFS